MQRPQLRSALPFIACLVVGLVVMLASQHAASWEHVVTAAAILGVAGLALAVALRRSHRTWVDPLPAYLVFPALAVLFDGTGRAASPLVPLVAVPVLWTALFGTRRDLYGIALTTVVTLFLPIVFFTGDYPWSEAARPLLWSAIAVLIGPAVQNVVRQWQAERDTQVHLAAELATRERDLMDANVRWELLADHLPETAVLTLDEDLTIGLVAGSGAWAVGLRDAEGKSLAELSTPENVAVLRALVAEALQGRAGRCEIAATANGREQEVLVAPLPPAVGTDRTEVMLLSRDVSGERERARELAHERDRAELFFTEAPHGVAVLTPEGLVRRANAVLCEMLGVEEAELIGQRLDSWSENEVDDSDEIDLDAFEENLTRSQARWRVRDAAGDLVHLAISSSWMPESGEDGEEEGGSVLMHLVDVSEHERYEHKLAQLALHDALTGLPNRRKFEEELERHLDHCRRYGTRGAVLLVDLDHFKEVNDTLGHPVGDKLIVTLGNVLRRRLRSTDLVARLGGDEFAVLLSDVDAEVLERIAGDLVEEVRQEAAQMQGAAQRVTASIGALLLDGARLQSADIMSTVDMLLYDAKEAGRDQYALLGSSCTDQPRTAARLEWADRIEHALAEDGFELHVQPIVDLVTGRLHGGEVLIRMKSPAGPIPPVEFLPIAEQSNLIIKIDRWVIGRSVALLEQLQSIDPTLRLEVNLSGRSVGNELVEAELAAALARHDVDPNGLVLEITETAVVEHIEEARRFAERITAMGCRFALDDFGAGFGSFYYLKHLIFDYVKIDGEFVRNCDVDSRDRTILGSIVQMARGLGKQTIAEFVASPEILEVVRSEGIDFAQGYEVGRPVASAIFLAEVERTNQLSA